MKCAKCKRRPKAHPKAAYCVECRREYNRELRRRPQRTDSEERTSHVEGLIHHLTEGGQCSDYRYYWDMSARDVSNALGWYKSNSSQERESESS